jgi:hypothetical protein
VKGRVAKAAFRTSLFDRKLDPTRAEPIDQINQTAGSGRGSLKRMTNSVPGAPDIVGAARRDLGRIKGGREREARSGQIVARLPYFGPKDSGGEQRQADRLSKMQVSHEGRSFLGANG